MDLQRCKWLLLLLFLNFQIWISSGELEISYKPVVIIHGLLDRKTSLDTLKSQIEKVFYKRLQLSRINES